MISIKNEFNNSGSTFLAFIISILLTIQVGILAVSHFSLMFLPLIILGLIIAFIFIFGFIGIFFGVS